MDGFAVRAADCRGPATLRLIGEAAAGHAFDGTVRPGEAVRIFTGGPVPEGADTVVMQENASHDGEAVTVNENPAKGAAVRLRGQDFAEGEGCSRPASGLPRATYFWPPPQITPPCACAASRAAILATGDELVPPGEKPRADQIISSVPVGLSPCSKPPAAQPERLGIAADTRESLDAHLANAPRRICSSP